MLRNSTPINNYFLDNFTRKLSGSAFKCYMTIVRLTIGWHRQRADIQESTFVSYAGLSTATVVRALRELEKSELIVRRKNGFRAAQTIQLIIPDEWRQLFPNDYKMKSWRGRK